MKGMERVFGNIPLALHELLVHVGVLRGVDPFTKLVLRGIPDGRIVARLKNQHGRANLGGFFYRSRGSSTCLSDPTVSWAADRRIHLIRDTRFFMRPPSLLVGVPQKR